LHLAQSHNSYIFSCADGKPTFPKVDIKAEANEYLLKFMEDFGDLKYRNTRLEKSLKKVTKELAELRESHKSVTNPILKFDFWMF